MRILLNKILRSFVLGCLTAGSAFAQPLPPAYVEANGNNEAVIYTVPAGSALQEVQFWFISRGSISMPLDIKLYGPPGLSAVVEAAQLKGPTETALKNSPMWQAVSLDRKLNLKAASATTVAMSAVQSAAACPGFPDNLIDDIIAHFAAKGITVSREEACDYINGDIPDKMKNDGNGSGDGGGGSGGGDITEPDEPSPISSGVQAAAHGTVHKDECEGKKVNRYIVRVRVSLSGVDIAAHPAGYNLAVKIAEAPYKGPRAATIKPVSDGKFAPKPLALLTAGGWGDHERIEVYRWKKGKPALLKTLRVEDHVYARGFRLARAVASSVLNGGGKANFEWATDTTAYNVCFTLARRRQNANGYPSR